MRVAVSGRFTANDLASALTVAPMDSGSRQFLVLGINELARSERLVDVFPDWAQERLPVYLMT
jgi:hypothetical protein